MASIYKGLTSLGSRPAANLSQGAQEVVVRGAFPVGAFTSGANPVFSPGAAANPLVVNDTLVLLKWPAFTVLSDLILEYDTLDSNAAPTIIPQVGILNAALTGLASSVLMAATAANAKIGGVQRVGVGNGGTVIATDLRALRMRPDTTDRFLGVLVQTGPATGVSQATAGTAVVNRGKWLAATQYNLNDYLFLDNGQIVYVTTAGVSGATQPIWNTVKADTTADGAAVWTAACPVVALTATFRSAVYGN